MNTIIEKIRAEVLRLIRESDCSQWGLGKMSACNRILNFLDTLQEQPVCEGLEEEIEDWIECIRDSPGVGDWTMGDIFSTARHFAEWGAEHLKK